MADSARRTPLVAVAGLPFAGRDVEISECGLQGHVNLRGEATNERFAEAVRAAAGVALPLEANTVSGTQPPCVLWLAPDEWLLRLGTEADAAALVEALEVTLAGEHFAANDLSSAQTVIRLSGPGARRVLAKGCTLDLHPAAFAAGRCAQTNVAKAAAILVALADPADAVEVIVRRSFADYLARWLIDAGR